MNKVKVIEVLMNGTKVGRIALTPDYGEWKLSPAYDILPGAGFNGFHTTTVNNNGEPTTGDMIAVAEKIGLNKQRVTDIIQKTIEEVRRHKI